MVRALVGRWAFLPVLAGLMLFTACATSDGDTDNKDDEMKSGNIDVGDTAPEFSLPDQDGNTVSLSQYRGKSSVVLYFYPKDNTSVCTAQACGFRDSYEAFLDEGAVVIGVSSDSVDSHDGFAEKHRLPFSLLSDEGGKIRKLYGATVMLGVPGRVTYVIDKEGVVRHKFSSMFSADKHIDEALRVLKKLD